MRRIISSFVVLVFALGFVGNPVEAEAKPSLAQCQGEPSKGTGWGTFWIIFGGLNAGAGAVIAANPDAYEGVYENPSAVGIISLIAGGALAGLGVGMRSSANRYNETCSDLLSGRSLEQGFGLEPVAQKATGMRMIYRW